jgi:YqaJ-like viral recombinase domain
MKYINCEQGSSEWLQHRAGVITASNFSTATKTLKNGFLSKEAIDYACQLALERITKKPIPNRYITPEMRTGTEREPFARMEYEALTGNIVDMSGIILTDDNKFGYSSDGLINEDGMIEIKCPSSPSKIIGIWEGLNILEYMHQIQGGMWISGRLWTDFIMYYPDLSIISKSLFIKRIERNEDFIEKMVENLMQFEKIVSVKEKILLSSK